MDFNEQLFELIGRLRTQRSKTASTKLPEPRSWFMDKNGKIVSEPLVQGSKSASVSVPVRDNKAKVIADFISRRV
jgi:hypothetical protein